MRVNNGVISSNQLAGVSCELSKLNGTKESSWLERPKNCFRSSLAVSPVQKKLLSYIPEAQTVIIRYIVEQILRKFPAENWKELRDHIFSILNAPGGSRISHGSGPE